MQDAPLDVAEQVERARATPRCCAGRGSSDVADPGAGLLPHARALALGRVVRRAASGSPRLDERDEQRGAEVAQRIEEDRDRGLIGLDQEAGDGRAGDRRRGAGELELRVALDQLVALDDARQVRLVGDVEEDLQRAREERHDVDLRSSSQPPTKASGMEVASRPPAQCPPR